MHDPASHRDSGPPPAEARGWRKAIAHQPSPWAPHLSVSNLIRPGEFSPAEIEFALSLFFSAGEHPLLSGHGGVSVPVLHFYLDSEFLDPEAC